ncbi:MULTISPECIES: insoluble domain protein [unclassified Rhodococcus (in: high G+C Gram-positive bacteria)]|uniref:insoluble domain protein n=1 Tax=unclassified Rhodococcus (in: high G+C Gram-positive bacteria) TaxID=192944 RepID=UPI00233E81CB|nr:MULTISPECIES: insoluble domain protein [unclassified Rhodococcus (in: high G+C Gram-positive bacteria)]MDC3729242.1 insoluble domain protein [Rhodococcus sp. Rp3]WSE25646.1 insoluble domain protein [Rhodococcus sp. PD04]
MNNDTPIDNRAARRAHRRRTVRQQATAAFVASAAVAAGLVLTPAAGAAPSQGGTTGGATQGGTTTTPVPAPEPDVVSVPEAPSEPIYWSAPPAVAPQYAPLPNYDYDTGRYDRQAGYTPPLDLSTLHAPIEVEQAPIYIAPPEKIMVGDIHVTQPNWVTDADRERTNNTAGLTRSQVATFWKSVGVGADRADRVAAAQIGGVAAGATAGAVAGAVPGALIGGTIGGIGGAALGGVVPLPIPVLPEVTTGVAGTVAGAAIGAAVGAVPGAVVGGAVGLAAGTAFGAGDDEGQPIEVELPDVDQDVIAEQAAATVEQWQSSGPVGAAAAEMVQDAVQTAPQIDAQAREWVTAQPGGDSVIAGVDSTLETFFGGSAGTAAEMISTAIGQGAGAPTSA